jgi:glycosyltransferase involved in cell wall biosynthesis
MMHLFLNGLAASAGGGLTYLRNVVPRLAGRGDVRTTVAVNPPLRREFGELPNTSFLELEPQALAVWRFWQEQTVLPRLIRRSGADVLISAGNFALRNSPVPQILLSRNSLYTSGDFLRDLRARGEYLLWLDTRIKSMFARRSIGWADCTVAPSQAFAEELSRWAGRPVIAIHHGFDRDTFFSDHSLPESIRQKLAATDSDLRLLFVSHYNYYRNFETLFRALPLLKKQIAPRKLKLFLTCKLRSAENPGSYRVDAAAALVHKLGIADLVVELGSISYGMLYQVYRTSDLYVTPAYAESFAHPLVEAMACGLPIVASDLAVHREICGEGAMYFPCFDSKALADCIVGIAATPTTAQRLSKYGLMRSRDFDWGKHVSELVSLWKWLLLQPRREMGRIQNCSVAE